jgi:hypothetical protein
VRAAPLFDSFGTAYIPSEVGHSFVPPEIGKFFIPSGAVKDEVEWI